MLATMPKERGNSIEGQQARDSPYHQNPLNDFLATNQPLNSRNMNIGSQKRTVESISPPSPCFIKGTVHCLTASEGLCVRYYPCVAPNSSSVLYRLFQLLQWTDSYHFHKKSSFSDSHRHRNIFFWQCSFLSSQVKCIS